MASRFILQYPNGTYHCLGQISGWKTIEHTTDPWFAQQFQTKKSAISYKNNESHIRHVPMHIIELAVIQNDHGLAPLQKPDWDDFDERYDNNQRLAVESLYKKD